MLIHDNHLEFVPFPTILYNYKQLMFTDDAKYIKKLVLSVLIPFSLLTDLIIYIPRKIKYLMKYRKWRNYNMDMDNLKSKLI
jgi:hypothetical protein